MKDGKGVIIQSIQLYYKYIFMGNQFFILTILSAKNCAK